MIPPVASDLATGLMQNGSIRAFYLTGSHATGHADVYSDLDFVVVTADGATDTLSALWKGTLAELGELILWRDRKVAPTLINAIIAPDLRIDLLMLKPDQLSRYAQDTIAVLFDHDGLSNTLPETTTHTAPNPRVLAWQFEEFIRILGLLPLAIGRAEYINGIAGVGHLRNLLIELLIAETNAPFRGGALQLNRLLSDEQRDLLTSLPPLIPTRDGVIEAHKAYAAAYLHRARDFAHANDIPWPARFEDVTLTHIGQTLGLKIY